VYTPLDNVMWNCLAGPHAHFASGTGATRRYAPGFSPIIGFADPSAPDLAALADLATPGEEFYCERWTGGLPPGWLLVSETLMTRMVHEGPVPVRDPAPDAVPLEARHCHEAMALAALMRPGPFGLRTLELGDYFGYFDAEGLVAMGGERMQVPGFREISGLCTHPRGQGRGLARRLAGKLLQRQASRGERTYLNVMSANTRARGLYRSMGFVDYCETVIRIIRRVS
jgi:ribosomal protein S18 acetylase RimI-like enzyme